MWEEDMEFKSLQQELREESLVEELTDHVIEGSDCCESSELSGKEFPIKGSAISSPTANGSHSGEDLWSLLTLLRKLLRRWSTQSLIFGSTSATASASSFSSKATETLENLLGMFEE